MKKLIYSGLILTVFLSVSSASARNIWRECGIGGMLFQNTGWAAITSNIIWDLGTTATTSNVSSDDLCEGSSASSASLVYETYANVEEQTAAGNGEHLAAVLNILGCESSSHSAIIDSVRGDLKNNMSDASYSTKSKLEKAKDYHDSLMNNVESRFSNECQVI